MCITKLVCFPLFFLFGWNCFSPEQDVLEHPRLFTTNQEKSQFINSVESTSWKKELIANKKKRLEKYLELVEKDSSWLVSRLQMNWKTHHSNVYLIGGKFSHSDGKAPYPTVRFSGTRDWATDYSQPSLENIQPYLDDERGIYLQRKDTKAWEWVKPSETGHIIEGINRKIMKLAADAAFLYWLTGEEKYAQLAMPVFFTYMRGMYYRNPPEVIDNSSQADISGLATFEVIHEKIVIDLATIYDFLHGYFLKQGQDLVMSEAVFQKWGDQIIEKGVPENNWNLFQARFLVHIALILEDDAAYKNGKGHQYYLRKTFDESTERQIALKESILVYDQENGIWPESASYATHVTTTLLEILTLLDNFSDANELKNFPIIEKAALATFQYLFPSGYYVGFGDSHHKNIPPENFELLIANYRKYDEEKKEILITQLLNQLIEKGEYVREGGDLFELFLYVDSLRTGDKAVADQNLITPTFYAPNSSLFIQRIGKGADEMMIATVGSFGNHVHSNGIAIELYANNYVLGPEMGRGKSYWHEDFKEYYSQLPAHNAVVVDGVSSYDYMRSYNPFKLENSFPKSQVNPLFSDVTYAAVSFLEPSTMADQHRLTAQIRTPKGQPYAVDVFRSKKIKEGSQKHDYFYHNIGLPVEISSPDNKKINLTPDAELGTAYGDQKGYDYFSNKQKVVLDDDLKAQFELAKDDQSSPVMQLWVKGEQNQQIYGLLGPKSNALSKGTAPEEIVKSEIPAIMLRREKAAWNDPFVVLFNPHVPEQGNAVSNVRFDDDGYGNQRIDVSIEGGFEDVMIAGSSPNSMYGSDEFFQKGLMSVSRWTDSNALEFLFLSGIFRFQAYGWEIISEGEDLTVSIQKTEEGYQLENDEPFLMRFPDNDKKFKAQFFDMDEVEIREVISSRHNASQVWIRVEKPYKKIVVSRLNE